MGNADTSTHAPSYSQSADFETVHLHMPLEGYFDRFYVFISSTVAQEVPALVVYMENTPDTTWAYPVFHELIIQVSYTYISETN